MANAPSKMAPVAVDDVPVTIRPAIESDMPAKQAIKAHYVLHTLTELELVPPTIDQTITELDVYNADGYPHLVAVAGETLLGWVQLSPYRSPRNHTGPFSLTKELGIFVRPDDIQRGIGRLLVEKVFDVAAHPEQYDSSWISLSFRGEGRIRNIIAVMAFPSAERDKGDPRVDFYRKMGMELTGHLKAVAKKHDQWSVVVVVEPCPCQTGRGLD
jgi:phosphinothricin acetyltransferase